MKRRDFIKKSSVAVASAVLVTSGLVSCGGGSDNPPATTTDPDPGGSSTPEPDPAPGGSTPATISKTFYITDGLIPLADAASSVNVYFRGFSLSATDLNVPGQAMIVREGDTVEMTIINTLSTAHQFKIDGINGADSGAIAGGQQVTFSFVAGKPGTYLYQDPTSENRLIGLHGGFAVMPAGSTTELFAGSKTFVQQKFWLFNDIDPVWNAAMKNNTAMPARFVPRYFTLNGLSGKPPGDQDAMNPTKDSMADPRTKLVGDLGDRTLVRAINAGKARHSVHIHANHMEWLSKDGTQLTEVWEKDVIPLSGKGGICDVIYPFAAPPDAVPPFTKDTIIQAEKEKRHIAYPMHMHDEMTQTANGGSYMFGGLTDIYYQTKV